ncbi:MAG: hypothetical protein IJ449_01070 [Clostridia bacterium]|nr:hypothetical protein [Clostridia bacterium]
MKKFFYKFFEIQGICLDIVLVIAVVFFVVISIGQHPFRKDVTVDTVDKITIQYGSLEEYELPLDSDDFQRAIDCMQNIKIMTKRFDDTPIYGSYDYTIYAYLKSGEVRLIQLLNGTQIMGHSIMYVSVDIKGENQYVADYETVMTIYDVVLPYIEIIKQGT